MHVTICFVLLRSITVETKGIRLVVMKTSLIAIYCWIIMTATLFLASYQRNLAWRDELTLWEDVIKKSSNKSRGYNNVGVNYSLQGRIDDATAMYKTALRLKPDYLDAHNNLGNNYSRGCCGHQGSQVSALTQ